MTTKASKKSLSTSEVSNNNIERIDINERFEYLQDLTTMVVIEEAPSLILVGEGGLGKTYSVSKAIKDNGLYEGNWISFKGYSTPRGLFNALYDNNGKLIVFDDCDSILEDKVSLNILKSALDSYEKRTISWMAKMNKNDDYPQQFEFTGRIIFISNKAKEKIDGAILSRSLVIDLSMTPKEKVERMRFILDDIMPEYPRAIKLDALNFLENNKENTNLNMRTLITVSKVRKSFPNKWERLAGFLLNNMNQEV
jgi:hypothetical protein